MNEQLGPQNHNERTHLEIIQAAARVMAKTALQLLAADMHTFGSRPCQTCTSISTLLGEPFGCLTKARIE